MKLLLSRRVAILLAAAVVALLIAAYVQDDKTFEIVALPLALLVLGRSTYVRNHGLPQGGAKRC